MNKCIFYKTKNKCRALKKKECKNCNFYTTKEQYIKKLLKAEERKEKELIIQINKKI